MGKIGQALLPVGFPDPVGSRFGHCAKTLLAGFQGLVTLLQAFQAEVDGTGAAQGMTEQVKHHQAQYQQGAEQRREHCPQQLPPRQRACPGQVVAGIAQFDALVAMRACAVFLDMHASQAGAGAQARELVLGQLIDEQHDRRLVHFAVRNVPVGAYGGGAEYCRPAVEQHEAGDLFTRAGGTSRFADDGLQGRFYISTGIGFAGLAFEQGIGGALVVHHEYAFITTGAVQ
ncbi:hypothetical protein D3C81_1044660 [compost metagenome]